MNTRRFLRCIAALGLAAALGACQQSNTGDQATTTSASSAPSGIERFLLFPNPIGSSGAFETDTDAYASAYYRAIDPNNDKDTLTKWKSQNGFSDSSNPLPGTEHLVVFKDEKDLGYGRRMTGRINSNANPNLVTFAFFVENYSVTSGSGTDYSNSLNVEAAIARDTRWHVGTNAIEWSSAPCSAAELAEGCVPTARFAKFYNFSSADGTRQKFVNLDGKGLKAMPGPCITCHGGRGDPLTPADAGNGLPRFPLVENGVSRKRGDVQARMHGMNVGSFGYSAQAGWTRAVQEDKLRDFNTWILCTYPLPGGGGTGVDACRPTAGANEWQGTAADVIKGWYGPGMTGTFADNYIPMDWQTNNPSLYTNVVAPFCRTCHILRGSANQSDLDFSTLAKFQSYAARIKTHVFDRGNMPLAYIVYNDFWNSSAPQELANFINPLLIPPDTVLDLSGAPLKPGRPIADPGPDRMVRTGANAALNAENSLFASSYSWLQVGSNPAGLNATITNANSAIAIFDAPTAGDYILRLTVGNGAATNSKDVTITVDDSFPDPLNIRFAHVKNVFQNVQHLGTTTCVSCHVTTAVNPRPPVFYSNFDRDGSGTIDATDEAWFLKAIRARANLTDIQASPLLRKPTGNSHNGGTLFDLSMPLRPGLRNYSILYNWILAGMLPGGVAANPVVSASNTLTFSGSPLYSTAIPLAGTSSIGATNYLWSVLGPSGPTGAPPVISNPTLPSAVLNVPNVGDYVVQLYVDDGISSDMVQRTINVTEPTIVADFNPQTGTVLPTSPSLGRGNITLSSTSTYGAGAPVTCRWEVVSVPAGALALLDGGTTLDLTKLCSDDAILNVPTTPAGGVYQVRLTASTIGTSAPVTHALTVSSSAPTANLNNTVTPQTVTFSNSGTNTTIPTNTSLVGGGTVGTATFANVSASVSLNGSASTTPVGTLTYAWCLSSQPDVTRFPASVPVCPTTTAPSLSATTTMTVRATGSYGVQLTVDNGSSSATASRTVFVNLTGGISFQTIINTVTASPCTSCHIYGNLSGIFNTSTLSGSAPAWDNANTADGVTLYQRIRQRVNLTTPTSSLLVTCPQGGCGNMPTYALGPGTPTYDNFLLWIQRGAPPGN